MSNENLYEELQQELKFQIEHKIYTLRLMEVPYEEIEKIMKECLNSVKSKESEGNLI